MGLILPLALALALLSAAVVWFAPSMDSSSDVATVRAMAQALETDPKLAKRLQERNELFKHSKVATNFDGLAQTPEELIILKLTDHPVEHNSLELIKELRVDPLKATAAVKQLYEKHLKIEHAEGKLIEILALSFEVSQENPERWSELTQFYHDVVDLKNYPHDPLSPNTSPGYYALKLYLMRESDEKKRQDLSEMFLGNHPNPKLRQDVQRLLEEFLPQGTL